MHGDGHVHRVRDDLHAVGGTKQRGQRSQCTQHQRYGEIPACQLDTEADHRQQQAGNDSCLALGMTDAVEVESNLEQQYAGERD